MTLRSERVRLFQTLPHACGYFPARTAQNLVLDPAAPNLPKLYALSLARGFRRPAATFTIRIARAATPASPAASTSPHSRPIAACAAAWRPTPTSNFSNASPA